MQPLLNRQGQYCVFTTSKNRSGVVVASQAPINGGLINDTIHEIKDIQSLKRVSFSKDHLLTFNFDGIFNEACRQEQLYLETMKAPVNGLLKGQSTCVVLFGPSHSGKTYTLKGSFTAYNERGLAVRAVEDLLGKIKEKNLKEVRDSREERHQDGDETPFFESHARRNIV